MKNYSKSTTSKSLEIVSWVALGISLILMTSSVVASTAATKMMVTDYDQYLFIKHYSREIFLHSSIMTMFSMMGLFISNK